MKHLKYNVLLLAITLATLNSSFVRKKQSKEYGFMAATAPTSYGKIRLTVVDLEILDTMKAIYSCNTGGSFCHVNLKIDDSNVKKFGLNKEIMEFECDSKKVEYSGEGFFFSYELPK